MQTPAEGRDHRRAIFENIMGITARHIADIMPRLENIYLVVECDHVRRQEINDGLRGFCRRLEEGKGGLNLVSDPWLGGVVKVRLEKI